MIGVIAEEKNFFRADVLCNDYRVVKAEKYDDYVYIGYTFWLDGAFYVKSSQGFFGEVDKYKTPVVYNLTRFVQNNFVFR